MSSRDIHTIIKEEEVRRQKYKDQQQQEEVSSKATDYFLKVRALWKLPSHWPKRTRSNQIEQRICMLKRLYKFSLAYRELWDHSMRDFLKLHKLAKKEGISREEVVKILQLASSSISRNIRLYIDIILKFDNRLICKICN